MLDGGRARESPLLLPWWISTGPKTEAGRARIVETQRRRWRAPFEEPTHYKLVINLKIATATGIELPVNFLALADEVIE